MTYFTASLRIGNLLSDRTGGIVTVRGITKDGVWINDAAGPAPSTAFNPIPLTEEWLLKFGFEIEDGHMYTQYILPINVGSRLQSLLYGLCTNDEHHFEVALLLDRKHGSNRAKYVHQLQNLYFALTGEEINIKS